MGKIGFLGPKGTFSQEALEKYIQDDNCLAYDYNSIQELLQAVQSGELDEAVVPIENSLEGAVNATLDIMAGDLDLRIKAEIIVSIEQNLLVKPGSKKSDIRYILSHPQALGQCRNFINSNFPDAEVIMIFSTAGAAKEVSCCSNDSAAIGSRTAARVYGLEVLEEGIQDNRNNFTRFIVVSKEHGKRTGSDKTSIVFSTENKPGSLYRVLDIFNLWDINMTRIESRPAKNKLGKYVFFVDVEGHIDDEDIRDAFTMIKRKTSFFKFLGSYPQYDEKK
jgi:prephenate dehydratase